jgi:hypothetical protein
LGLPFPKERWPTSWGICSGKPRDSSNGSRPTHVIAAAWTGSDETGTHVGGKTFWQWVWQSPLASYYVVDKRRGYAVVKEHFTEEYQGVLISVLTLISRTSVRPFW